MSGKSLKILKIVLLSIAVIALTGFMVFVLIFKNLNFSFNFKSEEYNMVFDEKYNISDVNLINLDVIDADVYVKYGDTDEVRMQIFDKDVDKFKVSFENGTLKLNYDIRSSLCIGICMFNRKVIVYLPKEYSKNLVIESASGDIELGSLSLAQLDISTASGDVLVRGASKLKVKTASGNVTANDINELDVKTISGDIELANIKNVKCHTTSGEINIHEIDGYLDISTVSGDVDIKNVNLTNNSSISTVSGEVDVSLVNSVYINTSTKSGDIDVYKNDRFSEIQLDIQTTSGDIEVH